MMCKKCFSFRSCSNSSMISTADISRSRFKGVNTMSCGGRASYEKGP